MITYSFLQHYWWFIISLLGGILVFLLFVQGANTMIFSLGKTSEERRLVINSTGRKWEFTLHYARHVWRSVLCQFPTLLQYEFRRCLLVVDDNPLLVCHSGR